MEDIVDTLTIKLLTGPEKKRARKILELMGKIKNRSIGAFYLSCFLTMLLLIGLFSTDLILFRRDMSPMSAIGLLLTSHVNVLFLLFIAILFACVFSIPLYYGIFLPRARLRVLELKTLVGNDDSSDIFFRKLQDMRTLEDMIPTEDLIAFSNSTLNPKELHQFLTNSLLSIRVKI